MITTNVEIEGFDIEIRYNEKGEGTVFCSDVLNTKGYCYPASSLVKAEKKGLEIVRKVAWKKVMKLSALTGEIFRLSKE